MNAQPGPSSHLFRRATDLESRQPEEWDTVLAIPEYVLLRADRTPTEADVRDWAVKAWLDDVRDHGGEPLSQPVLRVWERPEYGDWAVAARGLVKATVRVSALAAEVADLKTTTAAAVEDAERWQEVADAALARAAFAEHQVKDWELRALEAEGVNERVANESMLRLKSWAVTATVTLALANALVLSVAVLTLYVLLG